MITGRRSPLLLPPLPPSPPLTPPKTGALNKELHEIVSGEQEAPGVGGVAAEKWAGGTVPKGVPSFWETVLRGDPLLDMLVRLRVFFPGRDECGRLEWGCGASSGLGHSKSERGGGEGGP